MIEHIRRLVRSLLVTGTVFLLAAGAHVLGGGTLPAPEILLALMVLVLAAVTVVVDLRLSMGKIVAVLGIGQGVIHQALSLVAGETVCGASLPGSSHHAVQAGACLAQLHEPVTHGNQGDAMALAHLLAAAVTAALLSRAEAALWRVVAWFRPLTHALQPITTIRGGRPRIGSGSGPVPAPWLNQRADGIREPPAHGIPLAWPI